MKTVAGIMAVAITFVALFAIPSKTTANHTDSCQSPTSWRAFIGRSYNPVGNATGVEADIDVGAWGLCIGATSWDFLYHFVDMGVAGPGCQVAGSCLVQYGIYRSSTQGTKYAWAYGGCNGAQANVRPVGAATTAKHEFRIEVISGVFRFFLDDVQQSFSLNVNDPAVACWSSDRGVDWLMEKADRGNGQGEITLKSQFDRVTFRSTGWASPPSSNVCFDGADNDYCTDFADSDFDGWSDNGGTLAPAGSSAPLDYVTDDATPGTVGVPWR